MNKIEIENWFISKVREFSLNPQGTNSTFINLLQEYNNKYINNDIQFERKFNPIIFANLFTKIRTIAFSTKTISNSDFILYRELLIIELNYYSKSIAIDFAKVLSNQSIQNYSKEIYNAIYIMFSHFVEIYNNLHQYKETTINTNIQIANTYLEETKKKIFENDFNDSLQNIFNFLKLLYKEYKEQLILSSS